MLSVNVQKMFAGGNGKTPPSTDSKKKTRDAGGNGKTPPATDSKRKPKGKK